MITQDRALEIAEQFVTRNGKASPRLMEIRYYDCYPFPTVTQIRYDRRKKPIYLSIPVWKEPVWRIAYFLNEGVAGSYDVLLNARTGELLEDLSI